MLTSLSSMFQLEFSYKTDKASLYSFGLIVLKFKYSGSGFCGLKKSPQRYSISINLRLFSKSSVVNTVFSFSFGKSRLVQNIPH